MSIKILSSDRVAFIGATGSGKTELAKFFLLTQNRVVVIDPKHTFRLEGFRKTWSLPMLASSFRIIVRPRLADDLKLRDLLHRIWRMGNVTIYCDEIASLADSFKRSTRKLEDIARTGREKHVSLWCAMQRPRGTPRIFLTETEVFFVFSLRSGEDRDYIRDYVGPEVDRQVPKFSFWYIRPEETTPSLLTLDLDWSQVRTVTRLESEVIAHA